jgi:ribosomal protein L14E/L6E/L27E
MPDKTQALEQVNLNVQMNHIKVGDWVRVTAGNAKGKTGVVCENADDYCVVTSDQTGLNRRFRSSVLEVVAVLPKTDIDAAEGMGSSATQNSVKAPEVPPAGDSSLGSSATQAQDEETGSTATHEVFTLSPGEGVALLPQLENLRDRLRAQNPLTKGWLNDEPRRMRYCYRVSGKLVCTTVKSEELMGYRDRLRLGRVLVAIEHVINYVQRGE